MWLGSFYKWHFIAYTIRSIAKYLDVLGYKLNVVYGYIYKRIEILDIIANYM